MNNQIVPLQCNLPDYEPDFLKWLSELAVIMDQFNTEVAPFGEYQVFKDDDERPAVSILLAAAARANFLAVSEYGMPKKDRKKGVGRLDLWIGSERRWYSFEFKRSRDQTSLSDLQRVMGDAEVDVKNIEYEWNDTEVAFAGVIAPDFYGVSNETFTVFSKQCDLSYVIGKAPGQQLYLFFNQLRMA